MKTAFKGGATPSLHYAIVTKLYSAFESHGRNRYKLPQGFFLGTESFLVGPRPPQGPDSTNAYPPLHIAPELHLDEGTSLQHLSNFQFPSN